MNASEAVESISMATPLIWILAVEFGLKVAQLVQLSHATAGTVDPTLPSNYTKAMV